MICIIFASYNGARTLPRMLDQLQQQTLPQDLWKLIAVNNNSSDNTGEILAAYLDKLPLTVLDHPVPGKNGAMNVALAHIEAELDQFDLIVCTDDDIIADPEWLDALVKASETQLQHNLFGGGIDLVWPTPPEDWLAALEDEYAMIFAQRTLETGPINADKIYGPNMAFRPVVFTAGHRFNEGVGPNGTATYGMGAETEFLRRMAPLGHRAWFVSGARVGHIIRPEQLDLNWILGRAYRSGMGNVHVSETKPLPGVGIPSWLLKKYLANMIPATLAQFGEPTPDRVAKRFHFQWIKGAIDQARLDLRSSQPRSELNAVSTAQ